jgi:anaerobic magnesium-protoporphyrin IX monomethyl ester cyclase
MARRRGITTIVSGSDASDHPEAYLASGADFVILGEGESTLGELVDRLDHGALEQVAGLAFHDQAGQVVRTSPRPFIKDLDALPRPAWDLVDVARYRRIWTGRHGYFSMNVATTRGCPYHCNWCAKPIYGQRYAVRSPESVASELRWLRETYAPDHVSFVDDIFGLKPGWVEAFADAVAAEKARLPFKCLSRADLLSEKVVSALSRAGCRTVWMGAESGSQKILDAMEKGIRVEQIREAAERLGRHGIEVCFFLQFGYPGETRDDIEKTLDLVRECPPDDIGVSVSYPLPGTPFHERVAPQLGGKKNWTDSDDLAMLYRGPFPTEFYRALHRALHKEFRLRRLWRRRGRLRHSPALLYYTLTLPLERWRVSRAARRPHAASAAPLPRLSREMAGRPTEQGG